MQFLKDLVNKRPYFEPRRRWKDEFIPMMIIGAAWHLAIFVAAYAVWTYINLVSDINNPYLLMDKDKKCSVYQTEKQKVKVCPSSSSQK
jgi:hypothetical protein